MKARQYARMLEYEDEESGMRIKRLWSFHDQAQGRRFYADILELPADDRKRLIRQYTRFLKQIRSVRKAMADYFAGQRFFDFYTDEPEEEEAEFELKPPSRSRQETGAKGKIRAALRAGLGIGEKCRRAALHPHLYPYLHRHPLRFF